MRVIEEIADWLDREPRQLMSAARIVNVDRLERQC
jgi:hypothetical protein